MGIEQTGEQANQQPGANGIKKRARRKIKFPYSDLARAEELCSALLEIAGRAEAEQTQLAVKLDMSANGGTFRGRLSAARMFGLIQTPGSRVLLTSLGRQILEDNTRAQARSTAFLNIELYAAMYERYNGYSLPPAAAVERQMEELGVPPKQKERARQAFAASAETAGYIADNGRFSKPALAPPSPNAPAPEAEDTAEEDDYGDERGSGGGGGNGGGAGGDRPLQYQLIDLLQDAAIGDEERAAVWTLVQFLTRPLKEKAADE
ncbi:hypothetical protein SAMN06297468_1773 [Altererythrobacter xiamenensis]|uniref:Uncharacterized protein n=1 Tax=Altererythrobacter xiamenensis TaxID=1316679 RepID=A0A1Y6F3T5_9SPHN|nr:hypothetical protein [Altererythrobacter xiamenensis]SMQ69588.1 hypothetical protein SAMN06297468_1773 [Altererythrobacter xiamenensis]